jgi:hypothetical protein
LLCWLTVAPSLSFAKNASERNSLIFRENDRIDACHHSLSVSVCSTAGQRGDAANFGKFSDGSGSIRPMWDSEQWNWQFTHNKFNRPVVWNSRVFLPTYDGEVLVLGLA